MADARYIRAAAAFRERNAEYYPSAQMRAALDVLVSTLAIDEPRLLGDHARWAGAVSLARHDPRNDAKTIFMRLRSGAQRMADLSDREIVLGFLAEAQTPTRRGASFPDDGRNVDPNALAYLEGFLTHQAVNARRLAQAAESRFGDLQSIYFELLEPALIEAGDRWERAEMRVSQVHHLTDMTVRVMDDLLARRPLRARHERTFLALCVENERHDVGLRMICDHLQISGWNVVYFGSGVPPDECPAAVRDIAPTVIGLSVTMAAHLDRARTTIAAMREADPAAAIVVGGLLFRDGGDLWQKIGATAGATSGAEAVAIVERLAEERERLRV
jgi:methanogenic corrinoid protein MtbC1